MMRACTRMDLPAMPSAAQQQPDLAKRPPEAVRKVVGTLPYPIEMDRHAVGPDGVLWPRVSAEPLAFAFADRGRNFAALVFRADSEIRLHLCGEIAPLPYTIQSAEIRGRLLRIMRALTKLQFGRVKLDERQIVCIEADLSITGPVTPNRLIAAAALFVARTRAVVDRVAAEAAVPPKPSKQPSPRSQPADRRGARASRRPLPAGRLPAGQFTGGTAKT